MAKCVNCGKPVESTGTKPKLYCSDACRMKYKRTLQTNTANEQVQTNKQAEPEQTRTNIPADFGTADCQCMMCQINRRQGSRHIINHGRHKTADQLGKNELNRVSLPGDADYDGIMQC